MRGLSFALVALLFGGIAEAAPKIVPARLETVLGAIRKPGARAVLVNVWATWCEPCREEMPDIVRAYRAHKARGLRLVLVSSDDEEKQAEAEKFLASQGVDVDSFLKVGDDNDFINGLEPRWSGALPASFLYDGRGHLLAFWQRPITHRELTAKLTEALKRRNK
ncbi:MAG TPA: TlpA disulfide reductase family protein [Polyangia bacterium]|nr:TlpA disulfide reductase family protein [Polyangia bacterium]